MEETGTKGQGMRSQQKRMVGGVWPCAFSLCASDQKVSSINPILDVIVTSLLGPQL